MVAAIFGSAYISAMLCRNAGLYIDGGRRGWVCVACFSVGWLLFLSLFLLAIWVVGLA